MSDKKLSQEDWNKIVDQLFELDEQHPYLGQIVEETDSDKR